MTSSFSGTDIFWSGSDTWVMWVGSPETARGQGQPRSDLAQLCLSYSLSVDQIG
jgi:hypothetical protein